MAVADETRTLARVVGPTLVAGGLALLARRGEVRTIFDAFTQDAAMGVVAGLVGLVAGLVLLAYHSRISSVAAVTMTVLGWLMVARGVALLFAPSWVSGGAGWLLETPYALDGIGAGVALLGAWLSTVGFSARPAIAS